MPLLKQEASLVDFYNLIKIKRNIILRYKDICISPDKSQPSQTREQPNRPHSSFVPHGHHIAISTSLTSQSTQLLRPGGTQIHLLRFVMSVTSSWLYPRRRWRSRWRLRRRRWKNLLSMKFLYSWLMGHRYSLSHAL